MGVTGRRVPVGFVHRSHAMRRLLAELEGIPRATRAAVVHGEPGTGKKRLAEALHRWWTRGEVITVECGLPHAHLAELFSFRTTLRAEKPGTLVLADIDQLEPALQREVTSLGSRIGLGRKGGWLLVATTTASLTELVRARQFDSNLADMLGGIVLTMPALRERRTDIAQLVRELLLALCDEQDAPRKSVTSEALDALAAYHWPGNVSELNVALEHATIAAGDDDRIDLSDLPRKVRGTPELAVPGTDGWPTLAQAEQRLIVATLQRFGGHQGSAAAALGIHPNTLGRKLKQFGLGRTRRHRPPA